MKKLIFRTGALVLLVLVLGSALLASAAQSSTETSSGLEGVRWILTSYLDSSGGASEPLPDTEITAEFKAGRVSGSAGCNTYSASYEAEDDKLTIGMAISTMMACEPLVMDQESAYLKNLQAAASYKIDGDLLTISNAQDQVLLIFQAEKPGTLTGVSWLMTNYNNGRGGYQSALPDVVVTAVFGEDGNITGNAGCNVYSASYTVNGDRIRVRPARTTRKFCTQPIMDQEAAYLAALESAATFKIEGNKLSMRDAHGAAMVGYVQASALPSPAPAQASPEPPAQVSPQPPAQATPQAPARAAPQPAAQAITETVYVTILPAADASVRALALNLKPDGAAQFGTDFGKETPIVQTGTWEDNADGTLTVTLTDQNGEKLAKPMVMKFQRDGTYLNLVDYDKAVWGENGLRLNLAADVARKIRSAMVTIDLEAGFPLDPTFVSVNGGGEVDAGLLGKGCAGYIHRQPVVTVNWTGEADMVRAFFYSDGDPTLLVLTPDGKLVCNDNANEQLLDPFVEIAKPVAGQYRIWIGSAAKNQLIPGVLVLTTKPAVDLGTFELGKLIKRPSIPQTMPQPEAAATPDASVQAPAERMAKAAPTLGPGAEVSVPVTVEGIVPLFRIPAAANKGCAGLVTGLPSYTFRWAGKTDNLHVAFEGDGDATLMVIGTQNKLVLCNDDAQSGNPNPAIDVPNPAEDLYLVYVGRTSPEKPVKGTLTISESTKE